jgi:hypothetical protein
MWQAPAGRRNTSVVTYFRRPSGAESLVDAGSGGSRFASPPANFQDASGVKSACLSLKTKAERRKMMGEDRKTETERQKMNTEQHKTTTD